MRFIELCSTDPAVNLAAEEWLLRRTDQDVFMLWRNVPSVIVGRNQNTRAQVNEDFVRERGIPVVRRLTGGGAVFHDLGNVNYTFIRLGQTDRDIDFRRFTAPIIDALATMGVTSTFEGRNDLAIAGKKISGNAQFMLHDRVLHHGTLLFSATMADLSGALRVDPVKYRDKAVKSIPKRVTNIAAHLPKPMEVTTFMDRVMAHVSGGAAGSDLRLTPDEEAGVALLADRKYRDWEWNFGYSPRYIFFKSSRTPGGVVEAHLDAVDGRITAVRLLGDYFGRRSVSGLEEQLVGCPHDRAALAERLADVALGDYLFGVDLPTFLDCLF